MSKSITLLKRLAREHELDIIEKPNGHFIITGGLVTVHYWPESRRQTMYAEGAPHGHRWATPYQAVNLATGV